MASVTALQRQENVTIAHRASVRAKLRLEFARDEASDRTRLAASHQEPPLRVVRAFETQGGAALVHLHNLSGGLLGGDQLALSVNVAAGAAVQITTTGATRIYRPREDDAVTTQVNEISVGDGALLEYLPDAVIPFAGVRFSQRTSIRLAPGAGLFWWEIMAPGREARGELFEYDRIEWQTDLWAGQRLVAAERVRLEPQRGALSSLARLAAYGTWATFYICRVGVRSAEWLALEDELRESLQMLSCREDALWGVSTLTAQGLVVRCAAKRGRDALAGLQEIWRAAKWRLYGRAAIPPRKVN